MGLGADRRGEKSSKAGRPGPSLTEQQEYWDDRWERSAAEYPHPWARRRGDVILKLLREVTTGRPRILDLGSGTGWLTGELAGLGEALGVDLSTHAVELARERYPQARFTAGNILQMSFPPGYFDVVVSQEVIAHVTDQPAYVRVAARALAPTGHLVLTTANKFVHERTDWPPSAPGHIEHWLDRKALQRLLDPHFHVLRTTTIEPLGHRGILRLVNSHKLGQLITTMVRPERLESWKGKAGFGWTRVVLARKR